MGRYISAVQDQLALPGSVCLTHGTEHAIRLLGRKVPAPVPVRLSIDTGSKRSALLYSVLVQLGTNARGLARLETSLGSGFVEMHWVRLEFPGTPLVAIPQLLVARIRMPPSLRGFHGGYWPRFAQPMGIVSIRRPSRPNDYPRHSRRIFWLAQRLTQESPFYSNKTTLAVNP
jgi:hypothetical protein